MPHGVQKGEVDVAKKDVFLYFVASLDYHNDTQFEAFLNERGDENWELVSVERSRTVQPLRFLCVFKKAGKVEIPE
jgi:hypothetical protein